MMKIVSIAFVAAFLLLAGVANSFATKVLPAYGGTNITAESAADGPSPSWTTLSHIEIYENGHSRWHIGVGTLLLRTPEGFEFNTNQVPSVSFVKGKDVTGATLTFLDAQTMEITVSVVGEDEPDKIHIGREVAIQVRPTDGNELAAGHIYRPLDGGTMVLPGIVPSVDGTTGTSFGDLLEVAVPVEISLAITKVNNSYNLRVLGTDLPCVIQFTDDLSSGSWQLAGTTSLGASNQQELDDIEPASGLRFYRAVRQ